MKKWSLLPNNMCIRIQVLLGHAYCPVLKYYWIEYPWVLVHGFRIQLGYTL